MIYRKIDNRFQKPEFEVYYGLSRRDRQIDDIQKGRYTDFENLVENIKNLSEYVNKLKQEREIDRQMIDRQMIDR